MPALTTGEGEFLAAPAFAPGAVPPVTRVRGSVIASSLNAARRAGMEASYFAHLDDGFEMDIRTLVTSGWLSIDVALAHYRAMDSLGFTRDQALENGRFAIDRMERSYIATVVKGLGRQVGPIPLLKRAPVSRARMLDGGDMAVRVEGPKDAAIEMLGTSLARYEYVRYGWSGMFEGVVGVVTRRCFSKVVPTPDPERRTIIMLSWV